LHPLSDSIIFLTLTRLVVVIKFVNFRFALFTPPPSRRLSKAQCNCTSMDAKVTTLCDELCKLNLEVVSSCALNYISVEPTLQEQIVRA
jgi:hypothetical protein